MIKRLVVFDIKNEKARLAFGAAIHELDKNSVEIIDQHAYVFCSNKTLEEIFGSLAETGIECPPDEFFILSLDRPFTGNGESMQELKNFLMR